MSESKKKVRKTVREKLPDLPSVGNQRRWDIIKVVLRSVCLVLGIAGLAELIALDHSTNDLVYWSFVAYPAVSLMASTS